MTQECPLRQGNLHRVGGGGGGGGGVGGTKGNPITPPRSRLIHEPQEGNPSPVGSNGNLCRRCSPVKAAPTHEALSFLAPLFPRHRGGGGGAVTHTDSGVQVSSARCEARQQRGGIPAPMTSGSNASNATLVIYSSLYDPPRGPPHHRALAFVSIQERQRRGKPHGRICHLLICTKLL